MLSPSEWVAGCEYPRCRASVFLIDPTEEEARQTLRETYGWSVGETLTYCPEHS